MDSLPIFLLRQKNLARATVQEQAAEDHVKFASVPSSLRLLPRQEAK